VTLWSFPHTKEEIIDFQKKAMDFGHITSGKTDVSRKNKKK